MMRIPCTWQLLPIVGIIRWDLTQTHFLQEKPLIDWPPWDFDSCLELVIDLSAKKTQSREQPYLDERTHDYEQSGYAFIRKGIKEGIIPKIREDWHCQPKRWNTGVWRNHDSDLSVVAPRPFQTMDLLEDPQP